MQEGDFREISLPCNISLYSLILKIILIAEKIGEREREKFLWNNIISVYLANVKYILRNIQEVFLYMPFLHCSL